MPDYHLRQQEIQRQLSLVVAEIQKNEEQFWQLIEAIPNGVIITNASGIITYTNQRVEGMFGYTPDELIGETVDMLLPDHLRDQHQSHRKSYFSNPANRPMGQNMELIAQRKDGSNFLVEIGLGHLPSNREDEAIAFIVDITTRKQTHQKLLEQERLLQSSQEIAHIGSWEVNLDTGETIWSDEFFRICGLEPQSVEPSSEIGFSLIHPDDRDKVAQAFEATQQTNEPYDIEKRIVRPTGEIRWVISQGEIKIDDLTGENRLSGVFIDITERKRLQEQQLKLKLEKERLNLLSGFVQSFSHEFRTPLSSINSTAYLMMKAEDIAVREQKMEVIEQQVQRSTQLLDTLLTMVVLETVSSLDVMPTKIIPMLEAVSHAVRNQYAKVQLTLQKPDFDPVVSAHSVYLFDAISQVVGNACRFTQDRGTITLSLNQKDDRVQIICADTGIGIAEEHLPFIFSSFWREDQAHSTPGFGLGLTLAKKVIDMHGGTIGVESELGKGTTVCIELPLA